MKSHCYRRILIVFGVLAMALASGQAARPRTLLAYFNFDEESGPPGKLPVRTADLAGNFSVDDAVLRGVATITGEGYLGGTGNSLDVSGASTGAAAVVSWSHLESVLVTNEMSVSFWQLNNEFSNSSAFWINDDDGERFFQASTPWGDGMVFFDQGGCCGPDQRMSASGAITGQWQHFVFQRDRDGNREIWIDGVLVATAGEAAPLIHPVSRVITIGAEGGTLANSFNGLIDEFAIWDAVLIPDDIRELAGGADTLSILFEPSVYTLWAIGQGVDPLLEGPAQDLSGDGFPNLLHLALGVPIGANIPSEYPQLVPQVDTQLHSDRAALRFKIPEPFPDGIRISVEESLDGVIWSGIAWKDGALRWHWDPPRLLILSPPSQGTQEVAITASGSYREQPVALFRLVVSEYVRSVD